VDIARAHYTQFYDKELIKCVADRYKEDIERFGYVYDDGVK
jgi:hypothetical protein